MRYTLLTLALTSVAFACGDGVEEPQKHSITIDAKIRNKDGFADFITLQGVPSPLAIDTIIGKPFLFNVHPAGAAGGNDALLYSEWGTVPDSLEIRRTTPPIFEDGPFDAVLVIYRVTPADPSRPPPAPINGDLSAFSIAPPAEGESYPEQGLVRTRVSGENAVLKLTNRVPADYPGVADFTPVFIETLMLIP